MFGFVAHPPLGAADGVEDRRFPLRGNAERVRSVLAGMRPAERERALEVLEAMAGARSRGPNGPKPASGPSRKRR